MNIFTAIIGYYHNLTKDSPRNKGLGAEDFGELIKRGTCLEDLAIKPITQSATSATSEMNREVFEQINRTYFPLRRYIG